jgi:hypothetical protein
MHQRILTADNLASMGMNHNPICPLCNLNPEDARHLLINYQFAREVTHLLWSWFQLQGSPSYCSLQQGPTDWLHANAAKANGANLKRATGVLLYCWWNMWKERNKRIFDSVHKNTLQVAYSAKEEIDLYFRAFQV